MRVQPPFPPSWHIRCGKWPKAERLKLETDHEKAACAGELLLRANGERSVAGDKEALPTCDRYEPKRPRADYLAGVGIT